MIRPGFAITAAAVLMAVGTAILLVVTASEFTLVVSQLAGLAVIIFVGALLTGFARVLSSSTVPIFAAIVVEAGFADQPSWIRSLAIGCMWFVTLEIGTEAVERRDGSFRTPAALARRVQELATVIGIALVVGLTAVLAADGAPVRTVFVQAAILGLVLSTFVMLIRRVT